VTYLAQSGHSPHCRQMSRSAAAASTRASNSSADSETPLTGVPNLRRAYPICHLRQKSAPRFSRAPSANSETTIPQRADIRGLPKSYRPRSWGNCRDHYTALSAPKLVNDGGIVAHLTKLRATSRCHYRSPSNSTINSTTQHAQAMQAIGMNKNISMGAH
jgi:hypothetical protein